MIDLWIVYGKTVNKTMCMQAQLLYERELRIDGAIGFLGFLSSGRLEPARRIPGDAHGLAQFHQHDAAAERFLAAQQIGGRRLAGKAGQIHAGKRLSKRVIPDQYLIIGAAIAGSDPRRHSENKAQHNEHKKEQQEEDRQR